MKNTIVNEAKINDKAWFLTAKGDVIEFEPTITHGTYIMKHLSTFGITKKQVEKWAKESGGWVSKIINTEAEYGVYFRYVLQHGKGIKMQYTDYNQLFGVEGRGDLIDKFKMKIYTLMLNNFAEKFNMTVISDKVDGSDDSHVLFPLPVKTFKLNPSPSSLGVKLHSAKPTLEGIKQVSNMLNEMPYVFDDKMQGGGLDLEWEKITPFSVLDVVEQLTQLFSGKEFKDKYGNSVKLVTLKEKLEFIKKMLASNMVLDIARSRFGISAIALKKILYDILGKKDGAS